MFWQTTNIWVAVCFACGDVWNEFAPPPIGELPRTLDTSGSSQLSFWANDYGHHPARSGKPVLNIYLFSHWYHVPEPDYEVCPWSFGDRKSTVKSLPTMHHCPSFPGKRSTLVVEILEETCAPPQVPFLSPPPRNRVHPRCARCSRTRLSSPVSYSY